MGSGWGATRFLRMELCGGWPLPTSASLPAGQMRNWSADVPNRLQVLVRTSTRELRYYRGMRSCLFACAWLVCIFVGEVSATPAVAAGKPVATVKDVPVTLAGRLVDGDQ